LSFSRPRFLPAGRFGQVHGSQAYVRTRWDLSPYRQRSNTSCPLDNLYQIHPFIYPLSPETPAYPCPPNVAAIWLSVRIWVLIFSFQLSLE
jgi:hypothetical protein